ncbi:TlpA family protein disulfide reductase [Chryseobacterium soli]|uniref:TlpA family protein disulfide reductase n=1 Tax=Chryseobacterium soli TaxID=445961 RepID=UPI002955B917|nr:TlpA disulfide reductase family protein [Chryseobacterium soli]MDV7698210.1 TlpA family protein disulfide reductase [Chryseobacterium soli]
MTKKLKFVFTFFSAVVFSQNTTVLYEVKQACYDIAVSAVVDKKYYKNHTLFLKNGKEYSLEGKFILNVDKEFPLPYSFICEQKDNGFKASSLFLVSRENLNFKLDSVAMFAQPLPINNKNSDLIKDQYRFNTSFSKLFKAFFIQNNKEDNLKIDQALVKYSKENPNSFMLFWTLVSQFQMKGTRESYFQSFYNLSPKIKNSEYGKAFYEDMKNSLLLSEKSKFPAFEFENKNVLSSLGKKYTIIDFWFSHCQPCLEEIPIYKRLYSKYKDRGFEIINISTDRTEDIGKWERVIKGKELNWPQYLDENGVRSKFYNINRFPTTFLLDSKGVIIKKDISLEDLDVFLSNAL